MRTLAGSWAVNICGITREPIVVDVAAGTTL
jgi:hypothetical protein